VVVYCYISLISHHPGYDMAFEYPNGDTSEDSREVFEQEMRGFVSSTLRRPLSVDTETTRKNFDGLYLEELLETWHLSTRDLSRQSMIKFD